MNTILPELHLVGLLYIILKIYDFKENNLGRFTSGKYNVKAMKLLAEFGDQQGPLT